MSLDAVLGDVWNPGHDVSEFIMFYLFGFTLFQVFLFCLCVCSLSFFQARSLSEEFCFFVFVWALQIDITLRCSQ